MFPVYRGNDQRRRERREEEERRRREEQRRQRRNDNRNRFNQLDTNERIDIYIPLVISPVIGRTRQNGNWQQAENVINAFLRQRFGERHRRVIPSDNEVEHVDGWIYWDRYRRMPYDIKRIRYLRNHDSYKLSTSRPQLNMLNTFDGVYYCVTPSGFVHKVTPRQVLEIIYERGFTHNGFYDRTNI
jgi:hypothetical protein